MLKVMESQDDMRTERRIPALLSTVQHLARFGVLHLSQEIEEQLGHISEATVIWIVHKHHDRKQCLPQKGSERAKLDVVHCGRETEHESLL